tara:strand:- start:3383 stop:3544 length:162 start_codon:yes stop_codon:yes gene_type:complete
MKNINEKNDIKPNKKQPVFSYIIEKLREKGSYIRIYGLLILITIIYAIDLFYK